MDEEMPTHGPPAGGGLIPLFGRVPSASKAYPPFEMLHGCPDVAVLPCSLKAALTTLFPACSMLMWTWMAVQMAQSVVVPPTIPQSSIPPQLGLWSLA